MPVIVVAHTSALVAYVVAAALRLSHGRRASIVIVEVFDKRTLPHAVRPWCGASTVLNRRIASWPFLRDALLAGVLGSCVVFLDSVHVRDYGDQRAAFTPDLPFWHQRLRLVVRQGPPAASLAVLYEPAQVVAALRLFLLSCANVSFTSVASAAAIPLVVQQLRAQHAGVVLVDFVEPQPALDLDVLVNTRLSAVESSNARMPHAVLWLPMFRGAAGIFNEAIFTSTLARSGSVLHMHVETMNMKVADRAFALRFDLLHALKASDYVLASTSSLALFDARF